VVALNITIASGLEPKSLESLQKAVFEIGGGDAALKADMSQYVMQLHLSGDSHVWGPGVGAAADALHSAASHSAAAPSAAVPQQMVLYALVLSQQTVTVLRKDAE
jgi:hypothetical protein